MKAAHSDIDTLAKRLKKLRRMTIDMQRALTQAKNMHGHMLQRIAYLVAVDGFSVDMSENVEDADVPIDLYVKWTKKAKEPMDKMERNEVYSFVHTLKGLGYRLVREQESAHDIEVWFNVR